MIANNNSFSLTAKALYLTQPTVSAYISKLEYELGEKLFYRTTKNVTLTEAGKKIYIYAKDMVELADKIENAFKKDSKENARQMLISASSIPGAYLLPGILAEFSRSFPNVEVRVHETDSGGVVSDIREHRVDIGFVGTTFKERDIDFLPFCRDELILVTPNTDRFRELRDKKVDLSWIEQESWLFREDGSGTYKETVRMLEEKGIQTDKLRVLARFNNTGAILLSVKEGSGISVVSKLAAQSSIERGEVIGHSLGGESAFRSMYVVTSTAYPLPDICREMIRLIRRMYKC